MNTHLTLQGQTTLYSWIHIEDFKNLNAPALMIIGNTPLVSDLYQKYIQGSYKKSYSVNIRNRFKSSAEHLIIANYKINDIYKPDQESFTQS